MKILEIHQPFGFSDLSSASAQKTEELCSRGSLRSWPLPPAASSAAASPTRARKGDGRPGPPLPTAPQLCPFQLQRGPWQLPPTCPRLARRNTGRRRPGGLASQPRDAEANANPVKPRRSPQPAGHSPAPSVPFKRAVPPTGRNGCGARLPACSRHGARPPPGGREHHRTEHRGGA